MGITLLYKGTYANAIVLETATCVVLDLLFVVSYIKKIKFDCADMKIEGTTSLRGLSNLYFLADEFSARAVELSLESGGGRLPLFF
jgi:hypothetical protein